MLENYLFSWLIPFIWLILISYALFTLGLTFLWSKLKTHYPIQSEISAFITVIIPVRNEEGNILSLLSDISKQTFSADQFEVLVMNDSSTDQTENIVNQCIKDFKINIRLIHLPNTPTTSPKKRAIETAIAEAKGSLIVTTDGDCRMGTGWLQSIADCYHATGARLISGPVTFTYENSLTDHLQTVEFASLIGSGASAISAGFPSLCNGANLTYEKSVFHDVNGFEGVKHIASGDDEFLMHKIAARYPNGIHFLKNPEATVRTKAHQEWSQFYKQRKRWASKWKHYQSKTPLALALYVFLCNLSLILSMICCIFGIITFNELIILWMIKCVPEWLFLGSVLGFLQKNKSIFYIPVTQVVYPFYVCLFGLAAQKPEYEWKGRKLV